MSRAVESPRSFLLGVAAVVTLVLLWALRDIAVLVSFALLLAYALDPLVVALERVRFPRLGTISRGFAAGFVVLGLVILVGWLTALAVPRLVAELARFAERVPGNVDRLVDQARAWAAANGWTATMDPFLAQLRANAPGIVSQGAGAAAGMVGKVFGTLDEALAVLLLPILAFYLLAEREAVERSALAFIPPEARARVASLSTAVDRALRSYVRGQATVCLVMGAAVGGALWLAGFPVWLLLGIVVGLAEIIPYLGFAVAAIAIALTGYSGGWGHAMLGVGLYAIINQIVGMLVTPRVMSRYLKMHPFVITVSVLAGAKLLGAAGALLAVPGAAVAQALIAELAPARASQEEG
jgi:predicted PurR-regulated permease PerM